MTERRNQLYFGDHLEVLRKEVAGRKQIADKSVDLMYLDPHLNSNAGYNILFKEKSGWKTAEAV